MTPEQLFLIRHEQLGKCLQNQDAESMLQLSQVLRQMIVDGDRLLDIVNKKHQIRVRFNVGLSTIEREQEMKAIGIPDTAVHFFISWARFPLMSRKRISKSKTF